MLTIPEDFIKLKDKNIIKAGQKSFKCHTSKDMSNLYIQE